MGETTETAGLSQVLFLTTTTMKCYTAFHMGYSTGTGLRKDRYESLAECYKKTQNFL